MKHPFLQAIRERVLVLDGAMGTMLYAKGVFINRSFDALNLNEPTLKYYALNKDQPRSFYNNGRQYYFAVHFKF